MIDAASCSLVRFRPSGGPPTPSQNSLTTLPGATGVTPIPSPVTMSRVFLARTVTAHFDAPYRFPG